MRLTDSEQRLCDELVRDVKATEWPGGIIPDEDTPLHVIRAAYEKLLALGVPVRLDRREIMRDDPPTHET